jgi:polyphosphate kinase
MVDPAIIALLYEAAQAGVVIELVIRGMCCLRPGLPGFSDTIRVVSVIGRFLEHSRLFWFGNGGTPEVFIGSADWMPRNLDRRVEAVAPIEDPQLIKELEGVLELYLNDDAAWHMAADGTYEQKPTQGKPIRAQHTLMKRWRGGLQSRNSQPTGQPD